MGSLRKQGRTEKQHMVGGVTWSSIVRVAFNNNNLNKCIQRAKKTCCNLFARPTKKNQVVAVARGINHDDL